MITFNFIFIFIFGAMIGSFLNVVIARMPDNKSVVTPRSACPKCGHKISWFENIPIISYIFLRGKCRGCGVGISKLYPLIELITGLSAIYLIGLNSNSIEDLTSGFFNFSIFCALLCHFVIDLKHYLLLDKINLYLAVLFLANTLFYGNIFHSLIGALVGGLIPYLVTWLFYKLRGKVGLGGGDIKLWAALGIQLGPIGIIHNIWLSCMFGAIIGIFLIAIKFLKKDEPLPFGPFIILTASFQIFFKDSFISFSNKLLGF